MNHNQSSMKVGTDAVVLGAYADTQNCKQILDIGTGSGIISLLLAQRSQALITGIDIDPNSIAQAKENAISSPWSKQLEFHNCALKEFGERKTNSFDLIVSNPPFFDNAYKAPQEIRNNARHTDTLSHEELIRYSSKLMSDDGRLSIILPIEYQDILQQIGLTYGIFLNHILTIKPKPSKVANRVILEFEKKKSSLTTKELINRNEDNSYHPSYKKLTRDFYLKF
ncbi:MAG: methyltransferase domain-containing protein [Bacteroidales bacterium]|nr:methyltransferase domain-containing protein [Bacteroidales bacterium]